MTESKLEKMSARKRHSSYVLLVIALVLAASASPLPSVRAATYTMSASTTSVTVYRGESTTLTVTVTTISGTPNPFLMYLSWEVIPPPSGVTVTANPVLFTPNPSGTSTIMVSATSSASQGTYKLRVYAYEQKDTAPSAILYQDVYITVQQRYYSLTLQIVSDANHLTNNSMARAGIISPSPGFYSNINEYGTRIDTTIWGQIPGTSMQFTASAFSWSQFQKWVIDGVTYTHPTVTVTWDKNKTATAYFRQPNPWCAYGLSASPGSYTIKQGSSASGYVSATVSEGYGMPIYLTYKWVGSYNAGLVSIYDNLLFSPSSCDPYDVMYGLCDPNQNLNRYGITDGSSISVSIYPDTPPGTYILRLIGIGQFHNSTYDLYITVVEPTYYYATVSSTLGGTVTPSPGTHRYEEGTSVTLTATPSPGYIFHRWVINGYEWFSPTYTRTITSNFTAHAVFIEEQFASGGAFPCSLEDGGQLERAVLMENFGLNVTGFIPYASSPTQVTVYAWLCPTGAVWYDPSTGTFRDTAYNFSRTATTDSLGRFTIRFGDISGVFLSTNRSAPAGSVHYAYAVVEAGSNTYTYNSTFRVDSVMALPSFDYNLTGVNATFRFVYATDGQLVLGRSGVYRTSLEGAYSALVPGVGASGAGGNCSGGGMVAATVNVSRLSTPCDASGYSWLFVPYSEMNSSALRSTVELPLWHTLGSVGGVSGGDSSQTVRLTWLTTNTINYTVLAPMIYYSNATCMVVEAVDWGDRESLPVVAGAQVALYWDSFDHPFDGLSGLVGVYAHSIVAPVHVDTGCAYIEVELPDAMLVAIPIDGSIHMPGSKTNVAVTVVVCPDIYKTLHSRNEPSELWMQLVPRHTEATLYNPLREGKILVATRL